MNDKILRSVRPTNVSTQKQMIKVSDVMRQKSEKNKRLKVMDINSKNDKQGVKDKLKEKKREILLASFLSICGETEN